MSLDQRSVTATGSLAWSAVRFTLLFMAMWASYGLIDIDSALPIHCFFAIAFIFLCGWSSWELLAASRFYILTPLPWYYLACGIYFGLGGLSWSFAKWETIAYIDYASHTPIDNIGVYEATMLSIAGTAIVAVSMLLLNFFFRWDRNIPQGQLELPPRSARLLFFILIGIGAAVKFLVVLPSAFGLLAFVVPSVIGQLGTLLEVAIVLGFILVRTGHRDLRPFLFGLIVIELLSGVAVAAKTSVLYVVIAIVMGVVLTQRSMRAPAVLGAAVAFFYTQFLSPFIAFLRTRFEGGGTSSLSGLYEALVEFAGGANRFVTASSNIDQAWWARLTTSNYQKFAIDAFNSGQAGDSLQQLAWVFVPRILYPDKPTVGYGAELSNILYSGSGEWVLTSMTWVAEGYWNYGALGVILVCFGAALLFGTATKIVLAAMQGGHAAYLIVAIAGVQLAVSVESWWVQTFAGGGSLMLVYAAAAAFLTRIIASVTLDAPMRTSVASVRQNADMA